MQLAYGAYLFPVNGVVLSARTLRRFSAANVHFANRLVMQVEGDLFATGQAAVTTAENALKAALNVNYQNLVFYDDNGNQTSEIITNAGSYTGVMVTDGPHFRDNRGAEYATKRHFEFTVEAEYPIALAGPMIVEFEERVMIEGGGPEFHASRAVVGPTVIQKVWPFAEYHATQTGRAVGLALRPTPPPPLWPQNQSRPGRSEQFGPQLMGTGYINLGVAWDYDFISLTPLVGTPNLWPRYVGN